MAMIFESDPQKAARSYMKLYAKRRRSVERLLRLRKLARERGAVKRPKGDWRIWNEHEMYGNLP
jgi:lipopolysaccharide biosynthesis regulator YciM